MGENHDTTKGVRVGHYMTFQFGSDTINVKVLDVDTGVTNRCAIIRGRVLSSTADAVRKDSYFRVTDWYDEKPVLMGDL